MGEVKHTPGPWRVGEGTALIWGKCDPDDSSTYGLGYPICDRYKCSSPWAKDKPDHDEQIANAHLIAAAPTMLRALDAQHAWNLAESDGYGTDFDDRMELCNYAEWLIRKARAAAIGESFDEPYDGVPHLIVWPEAELRRAPEEQAAELVRSILEQAAKARGEQP